MKRYKKALFPTKLKWRIFPLTLLHSFLKLLTPHYPTWLVSYRIEPYRNRYQGLHSFYPYKLLTSLLKCGFFSRAPPLWRKSIWIFSNLKHTIPELTSKDMKEYFVKKWVSHPLKGMVVLMKLVFMKLLLHHLPNSGGLVWSNPIKALDKWKATYLFYSSTKKPTLLHLEYPYQMDLPFYSLTSRPENASNQNGCPITSNIFPCYSIWYDSFDRLHRISWANKQALA